MAPHPLKLATLPIRVTKRVAGEAAETARGVAGGAAQTALEVARGTAGIVRGAFGDGDGSAGVDVEFSDPRSEAAAAAAAAVAEEPRAEAPPPLAPREPGTAPAADPPPAFAEPPPGTLPAAEEPGHVDTDAVVVAESADPGTEDGIHTDLNVREPWDGYSGMTAADVIARLDGASPAEVAVVQLYESTHRARKTVIEAAQRKLSSS